MTETVTFQTVLDPARETAKAYKVVTGAYLPKSLVTFVLDREEMRPPFYGAKPIRSQHGTITMPKWLANR
jgi:hypothetical protein